MCNNSVNSELKLIQKQFLCAVPISKFNWLNVFDNFDWESQETLIALTVNLDLVLNYPVKVYYQQLFLKYIINRLESQGSNPSDCLYDAFGRVVTLPDKPTYSFKHYLLNSGKIISLKENSNIISEGTTGLCSWQASLALSEWCLNNKEIFKNKTVLELGAGVGLTGLTIALNCEPNEIYLTDCHPSVLEALGTNIKLNTSATHINLLNLPWEDVTPTTVIPNIDLLLAADVVYDSSLFPHLLNSVDTFFKYKNTQKFIIACTERNKDTLEEFLKLLENNYLKYEELELSPQLNFIWSTECPIKLLSVSMLLSD